jgi:hypothetical protein
MKVKEFKEGKKEYYIEGLCFIIPLALLRKTPSVEFYHIDGVMKNLGAIDKVVHQKGAYSPNIKGHTRKDKPWYMHLGQEDNLVVHEGKRIVELYSKKHQKVEKFEVTSHTIKHKGKVIFKGPAVFGWPKFVFHRIQSPQGSISTNYAKHFKAFDIKTNFNIYELNTKTGEYKVLREGHVDQSPKKNKNFKAKI